MGSYIGKKIVKELIAGDINVLRSRVLVMGTTFKEDVSDIRNSKVADVIHELQSFGVTVDVVDPYASSSELKKEYGFGLINKPKDNYDAVIVAVSHKPYLKYKESDFKKLLLRKKGILVDIKGLYRNNVKDLTYWSL